jgi:hypothetical protein
MANWARIPENCLLKRQSAVLSNLSYVVRSVGETDVAITQSRQI